MTDGGASRTGCQVIMLATSGSSWARDQSQGARPLWRVLPFATSQSG